MHLFLFFIGNRLELDSDKKVHATYPSTKQNSPPCILESLLNAEALDCVRAHILVLYSLM